MHISANQSVSFNVTNVLIFQKNNACTPMMQIIQITKFKSYQYQMRTISTNVMLAKTTHYNIMVFIIAREGLGVAI